MSKSNQREDNYLRFPWVWPMVDLLAMGGRNSDFVTFRIGTGRSKKSFLVHKTLACNASPVLKAAFNSPFVEGQTQTYAMVDIDPGVFESLMKWLYTKKLTHEFNTISEVWYKVDEQEQRHELNECLQRLARLWMLADRLLILRLKYNIMRQLHGKWDHGIFIHRSTWREFLHVDIWGSRQMHEFAVQNATYYSRESFVQKIAAFLRAVLMYLITILWWSKEQLLG